MTAQEVAAAILTGLDTLAWPVVVAVPAWPLRARLPGIGAWLGHELGRRGFRAQTPIGAFDVDAPTISTEAALRADERAAEQTADEVGQEGSDELRSIAGELLAAREAFEAARREAERATLEAQRRLQASPTNGSRFTERRIAAYAAELISSRPDDFDDPITIASLIDDDDVQAGESQTWEYDPPGTKALVALAFFKGKGAIGERFRSAPYEAWLGAARLLQDEYRIQCDVPPFTERTFRFLRRANTAQWEPNARAE